MVGFLIGLLLVGLIAGFVARAVVPGRDAMGVGATVALGVVGSFLGGFLGDVMVGASGDERGLEPAGIVGSIIGAVVVLLVFNAVVGRRTAHR